jgi:hypothetical protein
VQDSPAANRVLILDCCFSGRAIEAMTEPNSIVAGQIDITGVYTLTSASANQPANAPAGEKYTVFTASCWSYCVVEYLVVNSSPLARSTPTCSSPSMPEACQSPGSQSRLRTGCRSDWRVTEERSTAIRIYRLDG